MRVETFQKLNKIAEEHYYPSVGINPFDALLIPLLGEKELKLSVSESYTIEKVFKWIQHRYQKFSYKLFSSALKRKIKNTDIVFYLTEPTHLKQCFPIAKELLKKGKSVAVVSSKAAFREDCEKLKIPFLYLHPAFTQSPFALLAINDEFLQKIKEEIDEQEFKKVKNKVLTQFPALVALSIELKKLHKSGTSSQQWFMGNDLSMYGRIAAQTMRRLGIKTLSIQHGTIPDDIIHRFHLVDVMMVFGEMAKKRLLEKGIPESRIFVTGAPYTDDLLKSDRLEKAEEILQYLKLETEYEKRVLIVFSGPGQRTSEAHHLAMISSVLMLAQQFRDYEFIFKLHRKDKAAYYLNSANGIMLSNVRLVAHNTPGISNDIFDWFALVPTIITGNSAAGTEALLMDKTVFTLDFMNEYKGVDYKDAGVSIHSDSEKVLLENFRDYSLKRFGDELKLRRKYFTESYFHKTDGKSAERCAELIIAQTNA